MPLIIKRPQRAASRARRAPTSRAASTSRRRWSAAAGLPVPRERSRASTCSPAPSTEPLLAEEDLEGNRLTSIRTGDWKLITANPDNPRGLAPIELYDLGDDPREQHATWRRRESGRVAEMLAQLEQLRARIAAAAAAAGRHGEDACC